MNKVVHFEIPFDDKERSQKFYSEVFGWKMTDFPEMNYTGVGTVETDENQMPKEAGAINGGMFKRGTIGGAPDVPVIAIQVDSIDDHIEKIKAAGGEVAMAKVPIAEMGFYAYVKDTEGNIIGLWENAKK
jgi:predicted enzyme related to lactoylglutathione lyase